MNAPETFAEWSDIFDLLKTRGNEEELMEAAYNGVFDWEPVTSELWTEQFTDVLKARIKLANERFERDFSYSHGSEGMMSQSLIQLKKDLKFIMKLSQLPCIPDEQKPLYKSMISDAAKQIASSLESSAKADRSGKLLSLVRNTNIENID